MFLKSYEPLAHHFSKVVKGHFIMLRCLQSLNLKLIELGSHCISSTAW